MTTGIEWTAIAALGGLLSPIYLLLFNMNRKLGTVGERTENIDSRVERLEEHH